MNTTGFIRALLAKNIDSERFLIHVATCIEQQLQEWDPDYQVVLMKLKNYEMYVNIRQLSYPLTLSEEELSLLQNKSPYSLDREIWTELKNQGLEYNLDTGNYLKYVFSLYQ